MKRGVANLQCPVIKSTPGLISFIGFGEDLGTRAKAQGGSDVRTKSGEVEREAGSLINIRAAPGYRKNNAPLQAPSPSAEPTLIR